MTPTNGLASTRPDGYKWDVFVSYRRDELIDKWMLEVTRRLKFRLTVELGVEARVFRDIESIETGDHWPVKLQSALRTSKCLVPIWSPSYFQSSWCVSEWRSFLERERKLKLADHGLIVPIRYHDGDEFPPETKHIQRADFEPYTSTVSSFWNTKRADKLDLQIKKLASAVALRVKTAPPFDPTWPLELAKSGGPTPPIPLARL